MNHKLLLEAGKYYHIYNRGNNGQNIFFDHENYTFFLNRYDQYLSPFCDTIAWVLLKNHFHLLIYVKPAEEINIEKLHYTATEKPKRIDIHLQFGHFFNSYAKAVNKRYNRTGSLLEKNFERKEISSPAYLKKHYIHFNPVQHGFSDYAWDYPWSSYKSIISHSPTKLNRTFVYQLFKSEEYFKVYHADHKDYSDINELIIEF